jgi:hypothetical protein
VLLVRIPLLLALLLLLIIMMIIIAARRFAGLRGYIRGTVVSAHSDDVGFRETDLAASLRDLNALISWLRCAGIRVAGTRLQTYQRILHGFREAEQRGRELEFSREIRTDKLEGRDRLYNAMFEAAEWCSIYQAFGGDQPDEELRAVLRKAVKGPERYTQESKTEARDSQLELSFGALLKHAGFNPRFGEGGDLSFQLRHWTLFVECKRVQTEAKIRQRLRGKGEAHEQLEARYNAADDPRDCRGFVVISVTKPVNPEQRRRAFPSWPAMRAALRAEGQRILNSHESTWPATDPRTIGVAVELRRIDWLEPGPFICPAVELAGHPVRPKYHPDELLFLDVMTRLLPRDE